MRGNPYYIEPASPLKGFDALTEGIGSRIEYDRKKAEEVKKQKVREEVGEAEKTDDIDKINELVTLHPWLTKEVEASLGHKNTRTKQSMIENLRKIILGEVPPSQGAINNIEVVEEEGGEANHSIEFAKAAQEEQETTGGQEESKKRARILFGMLDPAASKELSALEGEKEKDFTLSSGQTRYDAEGNVVAGGGQTGVVKTYSVKNPDGSTRTVKNVKPGSDQEKQLIDTGFIEGTQTVGVKPSAKERAQERRNKATDKLTIMANEDPNGFASKAGRNGYRQNKDGSLFIDPVTGGPQELKHFSEVLGKRGNLKAMISLGEQWDDAKELTELLDLPTVQENLSKAKGDGLWDAVGGKWNNTIAKWLQDKGISKNSNTATAIARIQRMASDERKKFMGTAVTDSELRSALSWMPSAGDSFETMVNKTNLMGQEAEQEFRRWISLAEDSANMAPFYKAFGVERFTDDSGTEPEYTEGQTATGPNGEKLIYRNGQWEAM